MRETLFALGVMTCLAASLAFGADGPGPSYLGGLVLGGIGAVAASRAAPPLAFWVGVALLVFLAVRAFVGGALPLAGPELAAMVGIAGAFAAGHAAGLRTRRARRAAAMVSAGLLGLACLCFVLHAASPDAVLGRPKPYHAGRLTGPFLSANTAATILAVSLVWGLAASLRAARGAIGLAGTLEALGRGGRMGALLVLVAAPCLALTGSRAGIAAGAAGVILLLSLGTRRRAGGGRRAPILAAAFVVALVLLGAGGVLSDRLAEAGTDDAGRLVLWRASAAAWQEAPWLGHGLGAFARALAPQVTAETAPILSVQGAAHDLPLQWLVQTGLLGAGWGAAVLLLLARHLLVGLGRRTRGRWIVRAGLACLGAALLHGLVDYGLEVPAVAWWLSMIVGLASGVAGGGEEVTDRRATPRGPRRPGRRASR